MFYLTHFLYWFYIILLIFHAPDFWKWCIVPLVIFVVEKIYRGLSTLVGVGKSYVADAKVLASRYIYRLVLRKAFRIFLESRKVLSIEKWKAERRKVSNDFGKSFGKLSSQFWKELYKKITHF